MTTFGGLPGRALALVLLFGCAAGAGAGTTVDALEGKWTATRCSDPGTGTWTVFGNRIQFYWPMDRESDALEEVVREDPDIVETVVVSPDSMKGTRYRYSIVGDDVLIENLSDGRQQVVHRCS
jgi:hypothetical protein